MDFVSNYKSKKAIILTIAWALLLMLPILIMLSSGQWIKVEATYLVIHSIMEGFSIFVSFIVFSIGWNSYNDSQRCNTLIISCAFLAAGMIDLGHVLSYQGMPDFISINTEHKAIWFWLASRFLVVLSLFVVFFFNWQQNVTNKIRYTLLVTSILIIAIVYYIGLFHESIVPNTFVEGEGLTGVKIALEFIILLVLILTIVVSRTNPLYKNDNGYLIAGLLMMIASGICLMFYTSATDNVNLLGHIYKAMAYYFIYKAIFVSQVKDPYEKLSLSEKRLQSLTAVLKNTPDFVATADAQGNILYYNQAARRMFEISEDEDISKFTIQTTHPHWAVKKILEEGLPTSAKKGIWHGETAFSSYSGEEIPVSQIIISHHDDDGTLEFYSTIARDLSFIKQSEQQLQLSDKIIASMNEGVIVADVEREIVRTNAAFTRISGYSESESLGQKFYFFLNEESYSEVLHEVQASLSEKGNWRGELWNEHKNGSRYAADVRIHKILSDQEHLDSYAIIFGDITERKLREEEMRFRANYDQLTSLPNRQYFHTRFIRAVAEAEKNKHKLAVMFLDFDNFKGVNDTYGHHVGDILLQQFAERVSAILPGRNDTLARLGGDEFVLFTKINHKQEIEHIAQEILEVCSKTFIINEHHINISTSIGISLYPKHDQDVMTLIRVADEAMYIAKKSGKNKYQFMD